MDNCSKFTLHGAKFTTAVSVNSFFNEKLSNAFAYVLLHLAQVLVVSVPFVNDGQKLLPSWDPEILLFLE